MKTSENAAGNCSPPPDIRSPRSENIAALALDSIGGKLWIVERHRIRKYLPEVD
jgi:hypothetical protein